MSSNRLKVLLVSLLAVFAVSAIASASASAHEWIVCEEKVANTFKYKSLAECWTGGVGTGGKWERATLPENVTDEGTTVQKLKVPLAGVELECPIVKSGTVTKGTLEAGGKDTSGDIIYGEPEPGANACKVLKPAGVGCKVKSAKDTKFGQINVANVNTELVEAAGVLGDKFSPKVGTTFVTLELGKEEEVKIKEGKEERLAKTKCNAGTPLTTAVTGVVVGKVINATESIEFTNPPQTGSTLKAFGLEAILEGTIEVDAMNGGAIKGV